uniref:Uncharacterized protein n=1 Tax=Cyanoderma ruficeps TaxID=181631 RepID=A0A8C3NYX8_9PASS
EAQPRGRGGRGRDAPDVVAVGRGRAPRRAALTALCPQESAVGLIAMFVSVLGPAAWVLGNIKNYKKREE